MRERNRWQDWRAVADWGRFAGRPLRGLSNEGGVALPLALIALMLGTLLTIVLLRAVDSAALVSRELDDDLATRYAADGALQYLVHELEWNYKAFADVVCTGGGEGKGKASGCGRFNMPNPPEPNGRVVTIVRSQSTLLGVWIIEVKVDGRLVTTAYLNVSDTADPNFKQVQVVGYTPN